MLCHVEKSLSNPIYLLLEVKSVKMIYSSTVFGISPFLFQEDGKSSFFERGKL